MHQGRDPPRRIPLTDLAKQSTSIQTTLGRSLEHQGSVWVLDLTDLPIFHGLSVLSRALGEMVIAQAGSDRIDITVERDIRPSENPELREQFGLTLVKLCAEHETISVIREHPDTFQDHLRTMLGTLQRPRFRDALIPADRTAESKALVFHLDFPGLPCRLVLERVESARDRARAFLRITIEDPTGRRLELGSLPHVIVDELDQRVFIAGSTRIAQTVAEGVRREAERGRRSFVEVRTGHNHLFQQFRKAGLPTFERFGVSWGDSFVPRLLESEPERIAHLIKRVLLALEDQHVRELLFSGEVVRVDTDDVSVYLDVTQLRRVLHISLGQRRERVDIDHFLDRMPALGRVVASTDGQPLKGVSVFLVHHMTAEVLGLIAAFRQLGCTDLTCLFVAYAGDPPGSYLAPLLDLPTDEVRSLALINVSEEDSVEGHYRLSTQYSKLDEDERADLESALDAHGRIYYDAMKAIGFRTFLRQLRRARENGSRLLLVEDGGYVAPALNRATLEGWTIGQLLGGTSSTESVRALLDGVLVGSVEHTRNGYNRLSEVQDAHGKLAYPAFSIAVSKLKVDTESSEVSTSVLNAIENVLHANGRVLSRRHVAVLGSHGAIGTRLVDSLRHRLELGDAQLCGIDLKVDAPTERMTASWQQLPRDVRLGCDLVIGVTGTSVLQGEDLAEWLLESPHDKLVLASGSTKTIEFADLSSWVESLLHDSAPQLDGHAVQIDVHPLLDPITGRVFGHEFEFHFESGRAPRSVAFLANSTPVNFMFYGVPTELIDEVLGELLSCSLGLTERTQSEEVPCRLHAVDGEIDANGQPLP